MVVSAAGEIPVRCGEGGRGAQVMEHLGSAAFSRAVQARDLRTSALVCLKVVKVRPPPRSSVLARRAAGTPAPCRM